jgi:hypothetical protein
MKKNAADGLVAVTFVLAVACAALAVYRDARSDGAAHTAESPVRACADCTAPPPIKPQWEISKDAVMAEPIATF